MENQVFNIPAISCGHCTSAIENELREIKGVFSVRGDVSRKTMTVEWDAPANVQKIIEKLKEINYPPQ